MKREDFQFFIVIGKIYDFLKPDKNFFIVSFIYGVMVSILSLAIPIAVQSIVNTLAMTALPQQLLTLSLLVLGFLLASVVFKALQIYVIEKFQRYFFSRIVSMMADRLYAANYSKLFERNGRELTNRFFDIVTLQKGGATLATEGIDITLQITIGILLLALYHPYFILFDLALLFSFYLIWRFFGPNAVESALKESKAKYDVAYWMEEVAYNNFFLKKRSLRTHLTGKTDEYIDDYLKYREKHFRNLFGQNLIFLALYAILSSILLGLGGWLVMNKQLSIGQLVASELVITLILTSLIKSGKLLELFYDTYAAMEKVKEVTLFEREKSGHLEPLKKDYDVILECKNLKLSNEKTLNLTFPRHKVIQVFSQNESVMRKLLHSLINLEEQKDGLILYYHQDINQLDHYLYRDKIYYIEEAVFFNDTIANNLKIGSQSTASPDLFELLDSVELGHLLNTKNSLNQILKNNGYPLNYEEKVHFEFARAILQAPEMIIINNASLRLDSKRLGNLIQIARKQLPEVTIIWATTHQDECFSDKTINLDLAQVEEGL